MEDMFFFLGTRPTEEYPFQFNVVSSFIYFKYTDVRKSINEI